ncbi:MAG: histidinol-phosphatase HisJ family protein [Candidatus Aegiribacteria sp.]|nr:histidinol-phosphatase HisJ family protein [Candidatus Aegiribacteria sp.]MBD3295401.1 histidinol-phosphatase HisJ family protein [Candidatus Fermentibacteria bacterium]
MFDMHVHTDDSPDAEIHAVELVKLGRKAGLTQLGFVAHLDLNPDDYCHGGFDPEGYDHSIRKARIEAGGDLTVMKGLEVGEPHRFEDEVKSMVRYADYDYIVGALHWIERGALILGADAFGEGDPLELVEEYYIETQCMVEKADIDVLAHMGLFRRGMALADLDCSLDETALWPNLISRILETLVERDIALELNTSGLRRREGITYPTERVISLYRDLGGTLLTVGSDTHRRKHLFYGLKEGRELLLAKGFSSTCSFAEREPVVFDLLP